MGNFGDLIWTLFISCNSQATKSLIITAPYSLKHIRRARLMALPKTCIRAGSAFSKGSALKKEQRWRSGKILFLRGYQLNARARLANCARPIPGGVCNLPTVEEIVKMSKGGNTEYELIEYRGVKLLITRSKIKSLVEVTAEFTRDPAAEKLAGELGIKLRRFR